MSTPAEILAECVQADTVRMLAEIEKMHAAPSTVIRALVEMMLRVQYAHSMDRALADLLPTVETAPGTH